MEQNPYAPPKAAVADVAARDRDAAAPTLPLYSTTQIGVATFFGSALAGAWLAAANYEAISQPRQARRTWWLGIVATTVTMSIAFVLPDRFPSSILPLAVAFGARALAEQRFGALVKAHQADGGALRSWWRVAGISVLSALIVLVVIALGVFGYYLVLGEGP